MRDSYLPAITRARALALRHAWFFVLCIGGFKVSLGWHVFLGTLGILIWERGGREALASVEVGACRLWGLCRISGGSQGVV